MLDHKEVADIIKAFYDYDYLSFVTNLAEKYRAVDESNTYIYSICRRCGMIIKKEE